MVCLTITFQYFNFVDFDASQLHYLQVLLCLAIITTCVHSPDGWTIAFIIHYLFVDPSTSERYLDKQHT